MSKLTKAERDALPAEDFAEESSRLFPITDQQSVKSAADLIGKAKNPAAVKARVVAIARRKGLKIPDAWGETAEMSRDAPQGDVMVAVFDLGTPRILDGFCLHENSKLFEAGDYPDKAFSMTPEEMWLAVDLFETAPVGLEHTPNVLDKKLGEVRSVRLSPDGTELFGTVAIPQWLDAVLGPDDRKVSCEWDRSTKTLSKLDLVLSPRVPTAALMAAFNNHSRSTAEVPDPADVTPDPEDVYFGELAETIAKFAHAKEGTSHGQSFFQMHHDDAARAGAVCGGKAAMTSKFESAGKQKMHDVCVEHGAQCQVTPIDKSAPVSRPYYFANTPKKENRMSTQSLLSKLIYGAQAKATAEGTPIDAAAADAVTEYMATFKTENTADFAGEIKTLKVEAPVAFSETAEFKAMQQKTTDLEAKFAADLATERARVAALEAENRNAVLMSLTRSAASFAEGLARAEVLEPVQVPLAAELFAHLSLLDQATVKPDATVSFSEGRLSIVPGAPDKARSSVEMLAGLLAGFKRHDRLSEYVDSTRQLKDGVVLAQFGAEKGKDDAKSRAVELVMANPDYKALVASGAIKMP